MATSDHLELPKDSTETEGSVTQEAVATAYPNGSEHPCRVINYCFMDKLLQVTTTKAVLKQKLVTVDEAVPGLLLKSVRVTSADEHGLQVKIYDRLKGFVPKNHTADLPLSNPKKVVKVGQKIRCRVLTVDSEKSQLILTRKATLVNSDLEIVSCVKPSLVGTETHGVVVQVNDKGALVTFYQRTAGWLPKRAVQTIGLTNLTVGQPVRVRIESVDEARKRMTLSLVTSNLPTGADDGKGGTGKDSVECGSIYDAEVVGVTASGLKVLINDRVAAYVPKEHLTDCIAEDLQLALLNAFNIGDTLQVTYFSWKVDLIVSAKPILLEAVKQNLIKKTLDELEPRQRLVGVVAHQHPELGVFVDMPGNITGLAPYSYTENGSRSKFICGQTVIVNVSKVDLAKRHVILMMKAQYCSSPIASDLDCLIRLLEHTLFVTDQIRIAASKSQDAVMQALSKLKVGEVIEKVTVTSISKDGLICDLGLPTKLMGIVTMDHLGIDMINVSLGSNTFEAAILYVDYDQKCVELSLKSSFVKKLKVALSQQPIKLEKGSNVRGTVLLEKPDFMLILFNSGRLGYSPARPNLNNSSSGVKKLTVGRQLEFFIKDVYGTSDLILMPVKYEEKVLEGQIQFKATENLASDLQRIDSPRKLKLLMGKTFSAELCCDKKPCNFFYMLNLSNGLKGRLHISEVGDAPIDGTYPFQELLSSLGQTSKFQVKVIGFSKSTFVKATKGKRLNRRVAECTLKESKIQNINNKKAAIGYKTKFEIGESVPVFVSAVGESQICGVVNPLWTGKIDRLQCPEEAQDSKNFPNFFKEGQCYTARILSCNTKKCELKLSLLSVAAANRLKRVRSSVHKKVKAEVGKRPLAESSSVANANLHETLPKKIKIEPKNDPDKIEIMAGTTETSLHEPNLSTKLVLPKPNVKLNWFPAKFSADRMIQVGLNSLDQENSEALKTEDTLDPENDQDVQVSLKHKTKISKFQADKQLENELFEQEKALLDPDRRFDSTDDFDRALMGSPNSSLLWLRYMAFFLESKNVEKARNIGRRALQQINPEIEDERFNVWTALLNLENEYGTEETLNEVFQEAIKVNPEQKTYLQLLRILQHTHKHEQADAVLEEMLSKSGGRDDVDSWVMAGQHFMSTNRPEKAHQTMDRALKSLQMSQHVFLISRFAQMEFRYHASAGDTERGKTLFESLLAAYPKRTDVWSVYLDMLSKYLTPSDARPVFERVVGLKLGAHKMRFFLKKWLEFESKHGSSENVQQVKDRAANYLKDMEKDLI